MPSASAKTRNAHTQRPAHKQTREARHNIKLNRPETRT
ncbi:hypothetical protein BRPE64_ACDS03880 [Caballeronia insecticola]|uniref:Uncharacterized protein n=1 Tax=Caballeronia insecticola TaxID=758793 RepID=R4WW40_9BURK|nr:hypothetical protein BRPE64_ACDS03880 [Caballeronia insecticola]